MKAESKPVLDPILVAETAILLREAEQSGLYSKEYIEELKQLYKELL